MAAPKKKKKYVYFFGEGKAEGKGNMKDLLGGKGAGLAEMTNLGIRVPPGFTISTEACIAYFTNREKYPDGMWEEVLSNLKRLEKVMGMKFGDPKAPLLVSVRSGAKASMPGMMDTVLNLGLNDETIQGLIAKNGNERFALDTYRRFITMFASVVMNVKRDLFEKILEEKKHSLGMSLDTDLDIGALKELIQSFKDLVHSETRNTFPEKPMEQLRMAVNAVFDSWYGNRAVTYRRLNKIPDFWGTAVNIVVMVFGNMGETSGTGVAFTRDPNSGERKFFGEFLFNAQGEDVVAGIRTPLPISALANKLPQAYKDLVTIYKKLEKYYRDMCDIEFTIQEEKLYMLQTRVGKRTAAAAIKMAVDMCREKLIDQKTAILRVDPLQLDQLLHPTIDTRAHVKVITKGLPASPGAAVGKITFTAEESERMADLGEKVILVRTETSPEDIGGMHAAQGILTARGGMTSHAAVVARGMGKCCVVGCSSLVIHEERKTVQVGDLVLREGDSITLNGSTGEVILGEAPLIRPRLSKEFKILMGWVDKTRRLGIRTNADTPHDARVAREFGAEGIGLCRTEHMFFSTDRIKAVREMILSDALEGRKKALEKLLPYQKNDFIGIFKEMNGLPVTIRLLDPPLHEFLPHTDEELKSLSEEMGTTFEALSQKNKSLHEFNPMLGHRGCRLGITYPEIYEMQVQAIFEAACELKKEKYKVIPEIMIPLVAHVHEFEMMKELVDRIGQRIMESYKVKISYRVGTMIELPRAALVADQIARTAEFFSFGTNDLTQTTFGLSRDDAGKFLPAYIEKNVLPQDPFVSIDQDGVGALIRMGVEKGRSTRKELKTGICGEHGGEPQSVEFCHKIGLDYVSCSPYRVPIARLAAARAAINPGKK
ncbi:MAG: pyruvate, phosphate dikinase [Nitrospirae bacterium]|nr:pyruvate, phosphate dikinase [Nitrospirota bacterium]MBI3351629.1 pyruvate, phosphate dikinase [Nitrospirota bacterium]